jgi:predicted enzyme related to lactoylglutathione lyase
VRQFRQIIRWLRLRSGLNDEEERVLGRTREGIEREACESRLRGTVHDATILATHREDAMAVRIGNITFDCHDVPKMAAFWSVVLRRPLDEDSNELFASIGGTDGERQEPAWYFNKVPEPKRAKNRVHLDLVNPDPSAIEELVAHGATVVGEHKLSGPSHRWTVMQDPEGNEFCIAAKTFTGWD